MPKRPSDQPIGVLLVDSSRSQRERLAELLCAAGFLVVGWASDVYDAVEATRRLRPDIVAIDMHLPAHGACAATRKIMESCPTPVVMVGAGGDGAQPPAFDALAAGAVAVVRRPGSKLHPDYTGDVANLITTLRLMADVPLVTRFPQRRAMGTQPSGGPPCAGTKRAAPQVLALAASTGGPAAVHAVLRGLGHDFPLPVLLVQHIARGFVGPLVEWLSTALLLPLRIASHGERLVAGTIYLAPEDHHLLAAPGGLVGLRPQHPDDRYCPSADVLFESVAHMYGPRAIGVVLTGMGDDGAAGLRKLHVAGGHTLGQDSASCVVYGMPKAAAQAHALTQTVPLDQIAPAIQQLMCGH